MKIPGQSLPVGTNTLEDVVEITSYLFHVSSNKSYSEDMFDDDDDEDTNDDAVDHFRRSGPVENLKSYSAKTRRCLANVI